MFVGEIFFRPVKILSISNGNAILEEKNSYCLVSNEDTFKFRYSSTLFYSVY